VERKIAGAKLIPWRSSIEARRKAVDYGEFPPATLSAAILVLLILGGVAVSLVRGAWPALSHFGFSFITREIWNP